MTETILQTTEDFQLLQFLVSRADGPLQVTIAKHSCPQPSFRRRLEGFVRDTEGELFRVETVDQGGHGDRIGLKQGDIFVIFREEQWQLGVSSDLQPNMAGEHEGEHREELYALHVVRDLLPDKDHSDFEDLLDLANEELSFLEEEEEADEEEEETSKDKAGSSLYEDESDIGQEQDKWKTVLDEPDVSAELGFNLRDGMEGYKLLEFTISNHHRKPFEMQLEKDDDIPMELKAAFGDVLEQKGNDLLRFRNLPVKRNPYISGIRENDIYVFNYKSKWYLGKREFLSHRLAKKRPFRLHVLRKNENVRNLRPKRKSLPDQVTSSKRMRDDDDDDDESQGSDGSSPMWTMSDSKGKGVLARLGYTIVRCHVTETNRKVSFEAEVIEERCPREFRESTRSFFAEESEHWCRVGHVNKGKMGDQIGMRQNDILLKLFKNDWLLGTLEDLDTKRKRYRPFYLYVLRKVSEPRNGKQRVQGSEKDLRRNHDDFSLAWDDSGATSPAATTLSNTITQKRLYRDSISSKESHLDFDDRVRIASTMEEVSSDSSLAGRDFAGSDILELIQILVRKNSSMNCMEVTERICTCLQSPEAVEKLLCMTGRCHVLSLLDHSAEETQAIGWKVVRATYKFFPKNRPDLVESGLYSRIIRALHECETTELFEAVVDVLVSPIFGTDQYLREFASLDGAISSLMTAIDKQLGSPASYISCCRFLANILGSRPNEVEVGV